MCRWGQCFICSSQLKVVFNLCNKTQSLGPSRVFPWKKHPLKFCFWERADNKEEHFRGGGSFLFCCSRRMEVRKLPFMARNLSIHGNVPVNPTENNKDTHSPVLSKSESQARRKQSSSSFCNLYWKAKLKDKTAWSCWNPCYCIPVPI